jgi:hypothetical protein
MWKTAKSVKVKPKEPEKKIEVSNAFEALNEVVEKSIFTKAAEGKEFFESIK